MRALKGSLACILINQAGETSLAKVTASVSLYKTKLLPRIDQKRLGSTEMDPDEPKFDPSNWIGKGKKYSDKKSPTTSLKQKG